MINLLHLLQFHVTVSSKTSPLMCRSGSINMAVSRKSSLYIDDLDSLIVLGTSL